MQREAHEGGPVTEDFDLMQSSDDEDAFEGRWFRLLYGVRTASAQKGAGNRNRKSIGRTMSRRVKSLISFRKCRRLHHVGAQRVKGGSSLIFSHCVPLFEDFESSGGGFVGYTVHPRLLGCFINEHSALPREMVCIHAIERFCGVVVKGSEGDPSMFTENAKVASRGMKFDAEKPESLC